MDALFYLPGTSAISTLFNSATSKAATRLIQMQPSQAFLKGPSTSFYPTVYEIFVFCLLASIHYIKVLGSLSASVTCPTQTYYSSHIWSVCTWSTKPTVSIMPLHFQCTSQLRLQTFSPPVSAQKVINHPIRAANALSISVKMFPVKEELM